MEKLKEFPHNRILGTRVCLYCGKEFTQYRKKGPIPSYCSASHRQMAHQRRKFFECLEKFREQVREEILNELRTLSQ